MLGLSAGETTRVMLAKAFLARPSVVLLDEPTASLDPDIAHEVRRFVRGQRDGEGVSMVYTSHNMDEVSDVCDRVIFLGAGRIVAVGRPQDLAASAASTRVRLRVDRGPRRLLRHASARGLPCRVDNQEVEVEVDERHVADLLAAIAAAGVFYSQISLQKPTLEDYFLKLAGEHAGRCLRTEAPSSDSAHSVPWSCGIFTCSRAPSSARPSRSTGQCSTWCSGV